MKFLSNLICSSNSLLAKPSQTVLSLFNSASDGSILILNSTDLQQKNQNLEWAAEGGYRFLGREVTIVSSVVKSNSAVFYNCNKRWRRQDCDFFLPHTGSGVSIAYELLVCLSNYYFTTIIILAIYQSCNIYIILLVT